MLCYEDRMPLHRSLLAIILGVRWSQSGGDEINGVESDGIDALGLDVFSVLVRQFESGSGFGFFQDGECCGNLACHASFKKPGKKEET